VAGVDPGTVQAFVGLGSNLGAPERQLERALDALDEIPETRLSARSSLFLSPPVGPSDQPDFVNAVAELSTRLGPGDLLAGMQAIETAHGRVRGARRWGPRTLDLDLLLFGTSEIGRDELTVPHPRLHERAFVLVPLYEVAPELWVPGHGALADLLARVSPHQVRLLAGAPGNHRLS
jgi:2-amino-4-hydroxy-6-hydroxymethyldihydropteridine diphosphokinase